MSEQSLHISWGTIIKIFIAAFAFYVLFLARDIVVWFFFALIITLLVAPAINFLRRLKIPKAVAVIMVYFTALVVLGVVIYLTAPLFLSELKQLSQSIPVYFEKLSPMLRGIGLQAERDFYDFTASLAKILEQSSEGVFKALTTFFGGLYATLVIFSLAFFLSLETKGPEHLFAAMLPERYKSQIMTLFERAQFKVSGWFGARVLACLFVGAASFILFFLFGIKYAFILALVAGAFNFIPYIGPTATAVLLLVFTGISNSWIIALYILVAFIIIQQIEGTILTPLLMKRFIDLPPALVLIALLVGGTVFGFLGTIFAVPVFGILYEFLKEFLRRVNNEQVTY